MGITREGPIMNMDTEERLVFVDPKKRFTRTQASRLLKHHGVKHDPSAPMEDLLYVIRMEGIQPAFVPPGKLHKDAPDVVEFPNNVPKLRSMCKERGIKFKNTDSMLTLQHYLREYEEAIT